MSKFLITLTVASLLAVAGVLQFYKTSYTLRQSEVNPAEVIDNQVTIGQWDQCKENLGHQQYPCMLEDDFDLTLKKFYIELTNSCQDFGSYHYFHKDYKNDLLNYQNMYENCYFSDKIQSIAKSNRCFMTYVYIPNFVQCAGY